MTTLGILYPYDAYGSFSSAGVRREIRTMDNPTKLAPSVVYVSGSTPRVGANFYTRCSSALKVRPQWTFVAGGVSRTLTFPEKTVIPRALPSSSGGANGALYIATYGYEGADFPIPAGFTLGFEAAQVVFSISEDLPPNSASSFSATLKAECDVYVVANSPIQGKIVEISPLIERYSSIRNGCIYGHDTESYEDWIAKAFFGYFGGPLNNVCRRGKNGITLDYWKHDSRNFCTDLNDFFLNGNGRCGLFVAYLSEMVICQGYPFNKSQNNMTLLAKMDTIAQGDLSTAEINDITRIAQSKFGLNYEVEPVTYAIFGVLDGGSYSVGSAYKLRANPYSTNIQDYELVSAAGFIVPGQNNTLPRYFFKNHVVFISNYIQGPNGDFYRVLYDPSYGLEFPHLLFPSDPNNTTAHGVKHEEDAGIKYTRGGLAKLNDPNTGNSISVFVPLDINDLSDLDLTPN